MEIIVFLIILSVLIFVHELGHFLAAKWARVRVDEFGIGFPPRILRLFRKWNTDFTLNWIPFGGFVKIFGENYTKNESGAEKGDKKFTDVTKIKQAVILIAGVTFNFLLAWLLISISFLIGLPHSTESEYSSRISNPELMIVAVVPESPAFNAGLKSGDVITGISRAGDEPPAISPEPVSQFISSSGEQIDLEVKRGTQLLKFEVVPSENVIDGRFALGISMDTIGIVELPLHLAAWHGAKTSLLLLTETTKAITLFLADAIRGQADLSQVTGPVGIVGIVGDASELGFVYLLTFTAFISINLAVINMIPLPSLDGGRVLFVLIESIKGTPVSPRVFSALNTIGFALLIFLMVVITIRDVGNLF